MLKIHSSFMDWRFGRIGRSGAIALLCLFTIIGFAIVVAQLTVPRGEALAAPAAGKYEPWLKIVCMQTEVEEGDDFRLAVDKKYDSDWPHETIKVWWYTHPITADETDYERLHQERQYSNGSQSANGRMGRTFHTIEDDYPEIDETFVVEYLNGVSKGPDGKCTMTITDDDGVGIYKLEITSTPQYLFEHPDDHDQLGYITGETIEITAYFTGDVTTINPETGEQVDYAGIYIQVGENRRLAPYLRNYGDDALVFGYTVQPDDLDADGISVEGGGPGTGLGYNPDKRDGGIWIVDTGSSRINRLFHGLDDDPAHAVVQLKIDEPVADPPAIIEPIPPTDPTITIEITFEFQPMENAIQGDNGYFALEHGEITPEDGGRDWYSFPATGGEQYIIEVESCMTISETSTQYVENHLVDPSMLAIVNEQGERVMGEQDNGGFIYLWARAYFTPEEDGTYYVAVGSGAQARGYLGHYTISIREDDHADDDAANPDVLLRPGESITACIDSDIGPGDYDPHGWAWASTGVDSAVPRWGIESADDKDVIRFEITEDGTYRIEMVSGPPGVGLWAIFDEYGNGFSHTSDGRHASNENPVEYMVEEFQPGIYSFAVGTPFKSEGNTGLYTVSLTSVDDGDSSNGE